MHGGRGQCSDNDIVTHDEFSMLIEYIIKNIIFFNYNDQNLLFLIRLDLYGNPFGFERYKFVHIKAWSHECRIVPHRPTHEKRMPFNDLKTNDLDKGEK